MKKTVLRAIAVIAVLAIAFSFSGCNLFAVMRENAELAANKEIFDTPEDAAVIETLDNCLEYAYDNADKIIEDISYSVGKVTVKSADGENAGILSAASETVKKLIMSARPGSENREITDRNDAGMLMKLSEAKPVFSEITRNTRNEKVTDENEKEVTNENGEPVTEVKIADNIMHYNFEFFKTETVKDEDGNEQENLIPDVKAAKSVFDRSENTDVPAEFDAVSDYLTVIGYTSEPGCDFVTADADMDRNELTSVKFVRNDKITATVEGVGALADYGTMTVEFELTRTTGYSFAFPVEDSTI